MGMNLRGRVRACLPGLGTAVVLIALLPGTAAAFTTIGQIPAGTATGCVENQPYKQGAFSGGANYTAESYGVITTWDVLANAVPNRTVKLIVLQPNPSAGPNRFITAAKDQVRTLTEVSAINFF